ncbi:hypothetical protein PR048_017206 [Dryococelus australis]|uniref:PiggyBac transposable element-derived protein domain-containing protein n=1 Tax=Dryococelus australis TaxID=614101 RepID=A0ABQ9H901_9NEOP|nr:hypothetical protein PR048_017206 [Dryococelus australis]
MKFIRFDLKDQRSARLCLKFGITSLKIVPSVMFPEPTLQLTQLFPTKPRYKFTQYMANEPDKFGIKFWLAADDDNRPPNQSLSEHVVMKLMAPYLGKGRNVTTDNFFTSVSLAEKLKMQSTSLEGTVNRARREIPQSVKTRKAPLYDTVVTKNNETNLTVYQGKKNKNVLVLSTLIPNISIGNGQKHLPETESMQPSMESMYLTKWPENIL